MVLSETSNVEFPSLSDIALAGQTISQGLEQSSGQSSGSNSIKVARSQIKQIAKEFIYEPFFKWPV